ncbi:MAG: hypothetical protein ACK5P5_09270 [Pseudobdellovibrionaceae bacterium]
MRYLVFTFIFAVSFKASAVSSIEGNWARIGHGRVLSLVEFNGQLTASTRSFYSNGATTDWFFSFQLPAGRDVQAGEVLKGKVRSIDGLYNCVFEQDAQIRIETDGRLKLNYPLLTFTRRTTQSAEDRVLSQKVWQWNGWEWVGYVYNFPYRNWSVVDTECVIKQVNYITDTFRKQ